MAVNGRVFAAIVVAAAGAAGARASRCRRCPVVPGSGGSGGAATPPAPSLGGCPMFPANNAWNEKVDALPVRSDSATLVANISSPGKTKLHPDFGGARRVRHPVQGRARDASRRCRSTTPRTATRAIPARSRSRATRRSRAARRATGDRHVLVVQQGTCHLYELGRAFWKGNHWNADVGVNWNLKSNTLRPLGWTSADAAGLPILPGPRALRRGRGGSRSITRCGSPRRTTQTRLHPPRDALRVVVDESGAAADGSAAAAEGELLARRRSTGSRS